MANELLDFTPKTLGSYFIYNNQVFLVKLQIECSGCDFYKKQCTADSGIRRICSRLLNVGPCDYGIKLIE